MINQQLEAIQKHLTLYPQDILEVDGATGCTVFLLACRYSCLAAVRLLRDQPACDLFAQDKVR